MAKLRNLTSYEWTVEEVDGSGDITDVNHYDSYKAACQAVATRKRADIALTRVTSNDADGIIEREYAYLKDGKLPERFEDGTKVPERFHKESK